MRHSGPLCYTMQSKETKDHGSASDSNTAEYITPKLCRFEDQTRRSAPQTCLPRGGQGGSDLDDCARDTDEIFHFWFVGWPIPDRRGTFRHFRVRKRFW